MADIICNTSADFTAALGVCVAGDRILLNPATYTGEFRVLNRGAIPDNNRIIIQGNGTGMPSDGTRIDLTNLAQLPKLRQPTGSSNQNLPALRFMQGANGYTVRFVEFLPNQFGAAQQLAIGTNDTITSGSWQQTEYAEIPSNITIDRCVLRGDRLAGQKNGIGVHANNVRILNSYFDRYGGVGQDTVPISANNGQGPLLIENNFIGGGYAYPFITGGSDVVIRTSASVLASPAPTTNSATVNTIEDLVVGQMVAVLYSNAGVPSRKHPYITAINASTNRITYTDIGVTPTIPGNIQWGIQMQGITFRRNHVARTAATFNAILPTAPAPGTPTVTPGTGLPAGTYYLRVQGIADNLGYLQQDLFTPASTEQTVVVSTSLSTISASWSAVTDCTHYRWYRYQKDAGGNIINGEHYTTTSTSFTDTDAVGTAFTALTSAAGSKWVIKNIFELKHGVDVQVDSNIFEYSGSAGQAIWLKNNNQSGNHEFAQCKNIVIENNIIRHVEGAFSISGVRSSSETPADAPEKMSNIRIRNNLIYDSGKFWTTAAAHCMSLSGGTDDCEFDHNTFIHTTNNTMIPSSPGWSGALTNHRWLNNLMIRASFGFFGNGVSAEGKATLDVSCITYDYNRNVLAGSANPSLYSFVGKTNYFPTLSTFQAQFKNYGGTDPEDYQLKRIAEGDSIDSLYLNLGTDGADLGANIPAILEATDGVIAGTSAAGVLGDMSATLAAVTVVSAGTTAGGTITGSTSSTLAALTIVAEGTVPGGSVAPTLAGLFNLAGIARAGATRAGYHSGKTFVQIDGQMPRVRYDSLSIQDVLDEVPSRCSFIVDGFIPRKGQEVIVTLGSINNLDRLFAGHILNVQKGYFQRPRNTFYTVTATDYTWLLGARLVRRRWTNASATFIARELADIAGFGANGVAWDLPTVDEFTVTDESVKDALTRLMRRIGGYWYADYWKDIHAFIEETDQDPIDLTPVHPSLNNFVYDEDNSQLVNRVHIEGAGSRVLVERVPGDTTLPVETTAHFNPFGGKVVSGPQVLTYSGLIEGGAGALVGPGVTPSTPPVVVPQQGIGITPGVHRWAFTWVTASGETLPSPLATATVGPIASPATAPSLALAGGGSLSVGQYTYGVSFAVGSGETPAGPTSVITTSFGIAPPTTSGSASSVSPTAVGHVGGRYVVGDSVWGRCSFVDGSGNETGGTDTNAVTVADNGSGAPLAVHFNNLPSPSDPAVVLKRLYLNVNGGFVAYKNLAPGQFAETWDNAGLSTNAFPIGPNPDLRAVSVSSIPLGPLGTTARHVYRTAVNGSQLRHVATLNDNVTTTLIDTLADVSLGVVSPGSNTTQMEQAVLSGILPGPSGVTSRKLYRDAADNPQLKLLATLSDNTTTSTTDFSADVSLGANAPTGDTSGLPTAVAGQVIAGATSLLTSGAGAFDPAGGWAVIGSGSVIQYTGVSVNTLTGIPPTGPGSIQATVSYGSTIVAAPTVTGIPQGGDGAILYPIIQGDEVNLRVTVEDVSAQQALAALLLSGEEDLDTVDPALGVREETIQDRRLSETECLARGHATLQLRSQAIATVRYTCRDLRTAAGRTIHANLVDELSGDPVLSVGYAHTALMLEPEGYWRLGETSGLIAFDSSSHGRHAIYAETATLGLPGLLADGDTAAQFNGTSRSVLIGDIDALDFAGTVPFSVVMGVKIDDYQDTDFARLVSKETGSGATRQGWHISVDPVTNPSPGVVRFARRRDGTLNEAFSTFPLQIGVWYLVVCVYDGTNLRIYINGVEAASPVASSFSLLNHAGVLRLASGSDNNRHFLGMLDEVAIYSTVLSLADIEELQSRIAVRRTSFKIQQVQIGSFTADGRTLPTYQVEASNVRHSFEDLLRSIRGTT